MSKRKERLIQNSHNYPNATAAFSSFYAPSLSIFALKLQAKLIRLQLLCWLTSETTYVLKINLFYLSLTERFLSHYLNIGTRRYRAIVAPRRAFRPPRRTFASANVFRDRNGKARRIMRIDGLSRAEFEEDAVRPKSGHWSDIKKPHYDQRLKK